MKTITTGKSQEYRHVIVIENLHFQKVFCAQKTAKSAFSNSSGLKSSVFLDGLVWTLGLTVEIKLRC